MVGSGFVGTAVSSVAGGIYAGGVSITGLTDVDGSADVGVTVGSSSEVVAAGRVSSTASV